MSVPVTQTRKDLIPEKFVAEMCRPFSVDQGGALRTHPSEYGWTC